MNLSEDLYAIALLTLDLGAEQEHKIGPAEYADLRQLIVELQAKPRDFFGPDASALARELAQRSNGRFAAQRLLSLIDRPLAIASHLEEWGRMGVQPLSARSDCFPQRLRLSRVPPPIVFATGNLELLKGRLVYLPASAGPQSHVPQRDTLAQLLGPDGVALLSGWPAIQREMLRELGDLRLPVVILEQRGLQASRLAPENRAWLRDGRMAAISVVEPEHSDPFVHDIAFAAANTIALSRTFKARNSLRDAFERADLGGTALFAVPDATGSAPDKALTEKFGVRLFRGTPPALKEVPVVDAGSLSLSRTEDALTPPTPSAPEEPPARERATDASIPTMAPTALAEAEPRAADAEQSSSSAFDHGLQPGPEYLKIQEVRAENERRLSVTIDEAVLSLLSRGPQKLKKLSKSLGLKEGDAKAVVQALCAEGKIAKTADDLFWLPVASVGARKEHTMPALPLFDGVDG